MDQSKCCRKCQEVKSLDDFHKKSGALDGRQPYCRACNSRVAARKKAERKKADPAFAQHLIQYRAEHYRKNREHQRAAARDWRSANPERAAETAAAYLRDYPERREAAHRRYREANREKRRDQFRTWSAANPERSRERQHRRRARIASVLNVRYTADQLAARLDYFGGLCWMCGGTATTLDHVKPISRGGANALSNIRPACGRCNSSKRDRWFGVSGLHRFIR